MEPLLTRRNVLILGGAAALYPATRALGWLASPGSSEKIVAGSNRDFLIARHVRIEGTNREIGRALAKIARKNHQAAIGELDPELNRKRREYFAKRYPELLERAKGVAAEYGADWNDLKRDSIGLEYNGVDRPGCSTVFYPGSRTASGHPVLSRNYDFSTATLAELVGMPASRSSRAFTADPYILELYPDKGYASLLLSSYDLLTGCIDGMNSKGLSVTLLADDVSTGAQPSRGARVGLGEIEVPRFLLDRCANCAEAKEALKDLETYYSFIPCHYIVADASGKSFIWERTIRDGKRHVVDGGGKVQIVTNHLVSQFDNPDAHIESFSGGSFNRYCRLRDEIGRKTEKLTTSAIKDINRMVQAGPRRAMGPNDPKPGRTLWHSIYDLKAKTLEISFYLGEDASSPTGHRRSEYLRFGLR